MNALILDANMDALPEVNHHRSAVMPDHDVFRVQVPVDDVQAVHVLEGHGDLDAECGSKCAGDNAAGEYRRDWRDSAAAWGDRAATGTPHILVKIHATNFHHEHEEVWAASPVEQPDNMRMPLHTAQQV